MESTRRGLDSLESKPLLVSKSVDISRFLLFRVVPVRGAATCECGSESGACRESCCCCHCSLRRCRLAGCCCLARCSFLGRSGFTRCSFLGRGLFRSRLLLGGFFGWLFGNCFFGRLASRFFSRLLLGSFRSGFLFCGLFCRFLFCGHCESRFRTCGQG